MRPTVRLQNQKSKLKKNFYRRSNSMWSYWVQFKQRKCSTFFSSYSFSNSHYVIHHQSQHQVSTIFRKVPSTSVNLSSNTGLSSVKAMSEIIPKNIYLFVTVSTTLFNLENSINALTERISCLPSTMLKGKCDIGGTTWRTGH